MKNTLCCILQNRLGALDKVLGTLTHRGFLPEQISVTSNPKSNSQEVLFSFQCDEEKTLEKLIKSLMQQVYVLEVHRISATNKVAPLFVPVYSERRLSHAHHA